MASYGYILNATEIDKITTAFRGVRLEEAPTVEANSVHGMLPSAGYLAGVEFRISVMVGGVLTVRYYLSWDSAGDEPLTTIQTIPLAALAPSPTTPNQYSIALPVDDFFRVPAVQTTPGTLWAWFATTGFGAMTVHRCRCYWSNPHMRA